MPMEQQLRGLGGFLQLIGVGVVAWELHLAIARYRNRPSILDRLRRLLHRLKRWLLRHGPQPVNIEVDAAISATAALGAHVSVKRNPDALSTEEKVDELFRRFDDLEGRLGRTDREVRSVRDQHAKDMERVRTQIRDVGDRLERTAEAIETGDVRVRTSGFLCVMFGIVLATWSRELGDWGFMVALAWASSVFMTLRLTEFDASG